MMLGKFRQNKQAEVNRVDGNYRPLERRQADQRETRAAHFLLGTEGKLQALCRPKNDFVGAGTVQRSVRGGARQLHQPSCYEAGS